MPIYNDVISVNCTVPRLSVLIQNRYIMKVIKNYLWNAGYQIFILIVPFVTIPYVNRVLGPVGVGINSYTNSVVQYFILIASLGINIYGSRQIAYVRDDEHLKSAVFWELVLFRLAMVLITCIPYFIFASLDGKYKEYYFLQGILLIATMFDISWFFQGIEEFRIIVIRSTFVRIASLICVFIFVQAKEDTWKYVLILAVCQLIGFLTMWPYLRGRVISFFKTHILFKNVLKHARPAVALLIPQIATQIYLQLNKTMLGQMHGVIQSGYFDNSDKMVKMILAIVTATGTVLLPHVANSFAHGDMKKVRNSLIVSTHLVLLLAIPMMFGLMAVAQDFTVLFFSQSFLPVAPLMKTESLVIILIAISNAVGTQYLLPTNQVKAYTYSVVIGSIVNIVLNFPLIYFFSSMGATWSTVISEAVVTAYQLVRIRHQINLRKLFSETWKPFFAGAVMLVVIKLFQLFPMSELVRLISSILIGIVVYLGILVVLRPTFITQQLRNLTR